MFNITRLYGVVRRIRLIPIVLVFILAVGCTSSTDESKPTIAVFNLQQHPILNSVEKGVIDELAKRGYKADSSARFIMRNANGNMQRVSTIASNLATQQPDIVIPISTPVSQAVTKQVNAPVVFGALTDPVGAGIMPSLDSTRKRITGTTDALPYRAQLKLVRRISEDARRLGMLFNPGEASSQYAIKQVRRVAPKLNFELVEGPVSSSNEVYSVAQSLAKRVDVLLISTDNTVAAGIAGAVRVASEQDIPLYACDRGSVKKGAISAVSPGYYRIGRKTGELAARMLQGERHLPVAKPDSGDIYLNFEAARRMNVEIPKSVRADATKTYNKIDS